MMTNIYFWPYHAESFLLWEIFQKKVGEQIKTHFPSTFNNPPPPENLAVYDTMWKNNVGPDRPQIPIRSMRIACWTPKATNVHSMYVILIAFPLQQWFHERPHCCLYRYTACLASFRSGMDEVSVSLGCDTCVTRPMVPDVSRQRSLLASVDPVRWRHYAVSKRWEWNTQRRSITPQKKLTHQ
jgi:hypothetical protein